RRVVLFGGSTSVDHGTGLAYELGDTWERTASRWIQLFPAHNPGKRASHVMVYDSNRSHIVLFSGRSGATQLNDTWVFENNDWKELNTPNAPPGRFLAGAAFDPVRDRMVVFGGN